MSLPSLGFSEWGYIEESGEVFFKTSDEVKRVVEQGNATKVIVKLPGLLTEVVICFPIPSFARIYVSNLWVKWHLIMGRKYYFIGECGDGYKFYHLPKRVKYRYGVELNPWTYLGYLTTETGEMIRKTRSCIVNYVIENCSVGFDGIQLKFRDELESNQRDKEWFKVFWFGGGNAYHFWNEEHTEVLELLPVRQEDNLTWEPKGGWAPFKKVRYDRN